MKDGYDVMMWVPRRQGDQLLACSGCITTRDSTYGEISVRSGEQVIRLATRGEVCNLSTFDIRLKPLYSINDTSNWLPAWLRAAKVDLPQPSMLTSNLPISYLKQSTGHPPGYARQGVTSPNAEYNTLRC